MSSMFFHKIDRLPAKKKEIAVEEKRKRNSEHGLRIMKREIEYFKRYNLSFVIDDFHRPDGKIVISTDLMAKLLKEQFQQILKHIQIELMEKNMKQEM